MESKEQLAVTEGNKLIAGFMGFKTSRIDHNNRLVYNEEYEGGDKVREKEVMYHKSWEWLMPVVEKISRIQCIWLNAIADETDTYYPRTFGMLNSETKNPMVRFNSNQVFEAPTLIEATWLAVVEFIKDYQNLNQ
jgi:hypothetical protein